MPGQEEISEHIRAISIVDKYLEHARLFIFCNGGKERVYIGSADWMTRNLNRRVEVITPILDKRIQAELRQFFSIQWHDTVKARDLDNPLWNRYRGDEEDTPLDQRIRSQVALYDYYASLEK